MVAENKALVNIESDDLELVPRMVMSVTQAIRRVQEFQSFVQAVMVEGVDYGKIPGVDKPTLLKPGAEKLTEVYGLAIEIEVTHRIEDWDHGFFHYECKCRLINRRNGQVQVEGVGSCNTREKRYADRWVFESELPDGVDKTSLQRREFTSHKNGKKYVKYLSKNEDTYTLVNTVLKMAKKRALIDATLSATRSSGMFTQDVEDWVDADAVSKARPVEARPVEHRPANGNGHADLDATFDKHVAPPDTSRRTQANAEDNCSVCGTYIEGSGSKGREYIIEASKKFIGAPCCALHYNAGLKERAALIESWTPLFDRGMELRLNIDVLDTKTKDGMTLVGIGRQIDALKQRIAEAEDAIPAGEPL